jgi:two-component system KDP operon response regulator KdpE
MPFEHLVRPAMRGRPSSADGPVVLCIEDDAAQRVLLCERLEASGYVVHAAVNGAAAELAVAGVIPHAILLDLGLPDIDGIELCRRLVVWPGSPIIVVSADRLEERVIAALDAGASDYVTKPFSPAVLEARLRAVLRERNPGRRTLDGEVLTVGDLVLDAGSHELIADGERLQIHTRPFALLEVLMRNEGVLLPYAVLVGRRRGDRVTKSETQALRIAISRVRKAIGTGPQRPSVVTEPRVGYRLVGPEG